MLEIDIQTSQSVKISTKKPFSLKKLFNLIGLFIFGGLALSTVTNPIHSNEAKDFFLFISGSAIVYYFLVNVYFIGAKGRRIFFTVITLIGCISLFMVIYLSMNSVPH